MYLRFDAIDESGGSLVPQVPVVRTEHLVQDDNSCRQDDDVRCGKGEKKLLEPAQKSVKILQMSAVGYFFFWDGPGFYVESKYILLIIRQKLYTEKPARRLRRSEHAKQLSYSS